MAGSTPAGRTLYNVICMHCSGEFVPKDPRQRFCSHSCSAKHHNPSRRIHPERECQRCGVPIASKVRYCSEVCRDEHRLSEWLEGRYPGNPWGHLPDYIRNYLFALKGRRCWQCGWDEIHPVTGVVPVEIDHIDGNSSNNNLENLRVLCPNCHSLTPTFRNLNPNGRRRRAEVLLVR